MPKKVNVFLMLVLPILSEPTKHLLFVIFNIPLFVTDWLLQDGLQEMQNKINT